MYLTDINKGYGVELVKRLYERMKLKVRLRVSGVIYYVILIHNFHSRDEIMSLIIL